MLRIGTGAGFSSDRLGPAIDLAERGALDWLVFETIGERTLAFGHRDRLLNPTRGYNPQLAARMRAVLPHCRKNGTRIITNMGVANVRAAARVVTDVASELGIKNLKVAAVVGDEVTDKLTPETQLVDFADRTIGEIEQSLVGANAYLGIDAILPAIETGADVIITGRVADPSLFLAPLTAHFGWAPDDWERLGQGTLIGHLMECGMQVTGGYFADPGLKSVPNLANCGYPIAIVAGDATAMITKLKGSGGLVNAATVKEQLLYEVHDPASYLTPDVTADFSQVAIEQVDSDSVEVRNAAGRPRPEKLKVTVGFDGGYLGEAGVSYAGRNAAARAKLARDILSERFTALPDITGGYRIDLVGINALHATAATAVNGVGDASETQDVRLRVALRASQREPIETMLWEVESLLCCGPAGGGGYRGHITPAVITHSALIARADVAPSVEIYQS